MLVVNLLGEAGAGKSVTAAGLYYYLSINGFKAEVIPEVAKGYAWESPKDDNGKTIVHPIFKQQIFLLGEQNRMLERVNGKIEIAIMECPLVMNAIYKDDNYHKSFESLVLEQFNSYNNVNFLIERTHTFDNEGRVHTEEESSHVKTKLKTFLERNNIEYQNVKTHADISIELAVKLRDKFYPDRKLNKDII
ncbi:hypothetical protein GW796_10295 [archaeon]|nr:hypothetical protein [archaeon]